MEFSRMNINTVALFAFSIFLLLCGRTEVKAECGFPGTPAYGYVKPDTDLYSEGDIVTYTCRPGYILLGSPIRRCKNYGSWTEDIPICDESMTMLGFASSTPAMPRHPAELAIDRDVDSCTQLRNKTTRWWRIDMGKDYKVLSVALTMADTDKFMKFTVFVVKIQESSSSYKRCASFSGNFGTPTIAFSCAEGKGIVGQRVHIEDHLQTDGVFELCEVEVQVEKDTSYECGKPDRNPNSITFDVEGDQVEYGCLTGYELEGREFRTCLKNGRWKGEAPSCKAIICEPLPDLENGEFKLSVINGDIPLEGTVANFNCDEGYKLLGDFNRICLKDGSWSGRQPQCEAIRCPVPDGRELGGVYRLVNKTTRMGSMALLKCRKGKMDGTNPYIICTEEGDWTEPQSRCLIPARATNTVEEGPRIAKKEAIIFGMVVAGIMMTIVFVSLYVITQRRRARKPALPCRQVESPEAPPRPPPRAKGALASTLLECVTGSSEKLYDYHPEGKENEKNELKTRSLPLKNKENNSEWKAEVSPNRAISLDRPLHENVDADRQKSGSPQNVQPESEGAKTDEGSSPTEAETTAADATEQETEPDEQTSKKKSPVPAGREYAAVDYEKKRQSRLKKELSSEEGEENRTATPPSHEEEENVAPPTVPPKESGRTDSPKPETSPSEQKEEPSASAKESTESEAKPAISTEEKTETSEKPMRTRASADTDQGETDKGAARRTRRTRATAETPSEPEEKPTTRGTRRTRAQE